MFKKRSAEVCEKSRGREGKYKALGRNTPKIAVPTDIMINEIKDYIRAKTRVAVK